MAEMSMASYREESVMAIVEGRMNDAAYSGI